VSAIASRIRHLDALQMADILSHLVPHHRLEEARTVLLERKKRRQARAAARRDMKEQDAAKLLAEKQQEQRREAALERKATLDAEITARADVRQAKVSVGAQPQLDGSQRGGIPSHRANEVAHAAAAQAEALVATAAAAAATAAEQAEAAANRQVEAAAASAAAAVEVEAAATRSSNAETVHEHEAARLLLVQAELDSVTTAPVVAAREDEAAAAVAAAVTAAATAVAATATMPAPTASEVAPEGPGQESPLHATSEMDSWSESHPDVTAAAVADTAASMTEAEAGAASAAFEVAPEGPGQKAPLGAMVPEVDSHPDSSLIYGPTPVPGLTPDPDPHAVAEQLQSLGAPPEAGIEAGPAEADAGAGEVDGEGESFYSEEEEAPVKEAVVEAQGAKPEVDPSSAAAAAAAAALHELPLSPRQETLAAPAVGDLATAAPPLGSMGGAQLDAELQPQSAAPTPRPSAEGEQRRLEACAQSEAARSTAQSAARKAEVERQRIASELEQHKRAQDEAGQSKPKGGLRSVLGFNKKKAKAAQEQSAVRTAELGSRLEQLKSEAEAAAKAETRAEDEHRQVQERVTLERKVSAARARAAATVPASQAADASVVADMDVGAGAVAGAVQIAEAPTLPEATHGAFVPEDSADAVDEESEDESEDSDFDHSAREPPAAPLLKSLMNMAKLYGYEDSLPSNFDLERARHCSALRFALPLAPPSPAHQRRVRLRAASARGRRASMAHTDARCTVAHRRSFGGSRRRGGRAWADRPESDQVVPPFGRWVRACRCERGKVPLAFFHLTIFGRSRAVAPRDPRSTQQIPAGRLRLAFSHRHQSHSRPP
jgi:hypothetical protein